MNIIEPIVAGNIPGGINETVESEITNMIVPANDPEDYDEFFTFSYEGPAISFIDPTPEDNTTTTESWIEINASIQAEDLDSYKLNWNGVDYFFYDRSLALSQNYNNNPSIDEDANHTIDVSKYGNNGTIYGAEWTEQGKFNGCLRFDGNSYVRIPSSESLQLGARPATITAWIRTNSSAGFREIVSKRNSGYPYQWYGIALSDGQAYGVFTDYGPGISEWELNRHSLYDEKRITDGRWHQIVLTRDNTLISLWVDRELVSTSYQGPWNTDSGANLVIGGSDTGNYFIGDIDEVKIYTRALTDEEISLQYLSEFCKYSLQDSIEWRFSLKVKDVLNGLHTYYGRAHDLAGNADRTDNDSARTLQVNKTVAIAYTAPTLANGSITQYSYAEANITMNESDLGSFTFNWNGEQCTFYNRSLVLGLNLNNEQRIGESETKAVDISSYGNDGQIHSGSWIPECRFGGCMRFDGSSYVSAQSSPSLLLGARPATISAWIRTDNSEGFREIMSKRNSGYPYQWYGIALSDGQAYGVFTDYGPGISEWELSRHSLYDEKRITDGKWHQIVLVRNSTLISLWVDRELVSTSYQGPWNTDSGANLVIGGSDAGNYFIGDIDEVKMYTRALSAEEIRLQYVSEFQKYASDGYPVKWGFYALMENLSNGTYAYYGRAVDHAGNDGETDNGKARTIEVRSGYVPTTTTTTTTTTTPILLQITYPGKARPL
ncbi:MAG: LamG domain-containing protein [Candidatus Altiarchaeia archaeon]